MKKYLIVLLIIASIPNIAKSQWEYQNSNSTNGIYDIQFINDNTGFFCGIGIYKTENAGTDWSQIEFLSADSIYLNGCLFQGLHFFDENVGLLAGYVFWDNAEIIIRTSDGGGNWSIVHLGSFESELNDICFADQNNGFAIGKNGRILKTTNAGISWTTVSSGTTKNLKGIELTTALKGCIVGENRILNTTNGGNNWSLSNFPDYYFNAIHFGTDEVGYAVGNNGVVMKTNDGGINWQLTATNTNADFSDVFFVSPDTGLLTNNSGYILTTNSGGDFWEKQYLDEFLYTIKFTNSSIGYTAGAEGVLLKTINQGGWSYPIASFYTESDIFCPDSMVHFMNDGPESYTYEWQHNGFTFSTSMNASYTFTNGDTYDTINLIAYNSLLYDTSHLIKYVQPSLDINLLTDIDFDSLCPNSEANIFVLESEEGADYQLRVGETNIGNPQNGDGDTLTFNTGNILNTSTFNITATKENACGSNQEINYHTVEIVSPETSLNVFSDTPSICIYDSAIIIVENTETGTFYQLYNGNNLIGLVIQGNGASIQFNTGSLSQATTFSIFAINDFNCSTFLDNTQTIAIVDVNVDFNPVIPYGFIGDTITFENLSNANSYIWEFDNTASIFFSTEFEPNVSYNSIGTKTVSLTGNTVIGCTDSATAEVYIFDYPEQSVYAASCAFDTISQILYPVYWQGHILDYHVDRMGNSYVGGCFHHDYGINGKECLFLKKFDPNGNLLWEEIQDPYDYQFSYYDYQSSFVTGITTDYDLNTYITGSYASPEFKLDDITITSSYVSYNTQFYIAKLDSNGVAQWIVHSDIQNTHQRGGTDILYVNDNAIFVPVFNPTTAIFPNGDTYPLNGGVDILQINSDGNYENHYPIQPSAVGWNHNHWSILNPSNSWFMSYRIATVSPKLELSYNGQIYVFGKFMETLNFGGIELNGLDDRMNSYVAKLHPAYGWQDAFVLYGKSIMSSYTSGSTKPGVYPIYGLDEEENIYVSDFFGFTYNEDSIVNIQFLNGEIVGGSNNSMIAKFDNTGNLLWYNKNVGLDIRGIESYTNEEIILFGEYNDFMGVYSQYIHEFGVKSIGSKDLSVVSMDSEGNTMWIDNLASVADDDAVFMTKNKCGELYMLGNLYETAYTQYDTLINNGDNLFVRHFAPSGNCVYGCDTLTTSILQNAMKDYDDIFIFPNPADLYINIDKSLTLDEVNIFSLKGDLLIQKKELKENRIFIEALPTGLYMIEILSGNSRYYKKLIKK